MEKVKWNHYEVEKIPLGRGLYGRVFLAYDPINKRKVAIKRQSKSKLAYYKNEVFIMKTYKNHPYLPQLYDHFILDNEGYIVMEYIPGRVLGPKGYGEKGEIWDEKKATQFLLNLLKGLDHLHQHGILHNDLIPTNIMIDDYNLETLKIIDFGGSNHISKRIEKLDSTQNFFEKDLYNAAQLFVYLVKGYPMNPYHDLILQDKDLKDVIYKSIQLSHQRYITAQEFIGQLQQFI